MGSAKTYAIIALCGLAACDMGVPSSTDPVRENAELVEGPPVESIDTPFDGALACVGQQIGGGLAFSVGNVTDTTGKEQYSDGGSGKFITQGAGDMIQSSLFEAGLTVVNRRDPNIALAEGNWGIRNIRTQTPSDFYVTGSINSLDFIPGGGTSVQVAGVGPRIRQSRILVGVDLALTSAHDGKIVANSSIQKQLYTKEMGFWIGRFFGETLTTIEAGGLEREALHHTLRQVLAYAVFDLLAQVAPAKNEASCVGKISAPGKVLLDPAAPPRFGDGRALNAARAAATAAAAPTPAAAATGGQASRPATPAKPVPPQARALGNTATSHAAKAIAAADSVLKAKTPEEASKAADEALRYMTLAIKTLREAAAKGLTGPEGDAVATLVEKAITAAQAAQKYATDMAGNADDAAEDTEEPAPLSPVIPAPVQEDGPILPEDKRAGGPGK
ncbi:curli biogenesis system outer membrane secretion channel CsgG [Rhodobacter sp. JA431]|uniref:CsgG/HfaB family protein n=1 Tax=Rhodobacter sp. JA431 TaxID=570013 RepID=UPI000BDC8E78|nr:CsgG/HfaB family protein [Rhodobacter sp. JA431]SOB89423.1 curli biogenesis system outer membrane secretion channel CsgG [Rhodobacter sp. JA431]